MTFTGVSYTQVDDSKDNSIDINIPCSGVKIDRGDYIDFRTDLQKTMPPAPKGYEYVTIDKDKYIASYNAYAASKGTTVDPYEYEDIKNSTDFINNQYERDIQAYNQNECTKNQTDTCKNIKNSLAMIVGKNDIPAVSQKGKQTESRIYCAFVSDDDPVVLMNQQTKFIVLGFYDKDGLPYKIGDTYSGTCSTYGGGQFSLDGPYDTNIRVTGTNILGSSHPEIRSDLQQDMPPAPKGFQYMKFDKERFFKKTMEDKASRPYPGGWNAFNNEVSTHSLISAVANYQFLNCSDSNCLTNPKSEYSTYVNSFVPINSPAPTVSSIPVAASPAIQSLSFSPQTWSSQVYKWATAKQAAQVAQAAIVTQSTTTLPVMAPVAAPASAPVAKTADDSSTFYMILLGIVVLLLFMMIIFVTRRQSAATASVYTAPTPVYGGGKMKF